MDSKLYSKANIIWQVNDRVLNGDEKWRDEFGEWQFVNDLGIATAIAIRFGCIDSLSQQGTEVIQETWIDLCRIVMVDSEEEYDFFDDMLAIGVIDES